MISLNLWEKKQYKSCNNCFRKCKEEGCGASAVGKTEFCIAHGGGKRCPNCIDWIDSRSGCKKYDGYCATCFKRKFPNDTR